MKTDAQLLDKLLNFLNLRDREALVYWIEHAYFGYEYDEGDMVDDGDGLRPRTEEEIAVRRAKQQANWERLERGDGTPYELLSHQAMKGYAGILEDTIFTSKPLFFTLNTATNRKESDE